MNRGTIMQTESRDFGMLMRILFSILFGSIGFFIFFTIGTVVAELEGGRLDSSIIAVLVGLFGLFSGGYLGFRIGVNRKLWSSETRNKDEDVKFDNSTD